MPQLLTPIRTIQGFRTYPSFLHFLASVTLLAAYIAVISIRGLSFAFRQPLEIHPFQNEITPVHMLLLSFAGSAFTLIMGSFFGYHVYLVLYVLTFRALEYFLSKKVDIFPSSTNQTTLENIAPFYILRYLPPLPPCGLSSPPLEHQLASKQRRAVRAAHARMRLYDVGWRRNVEQVLGMGAKRRWQAWVARVLWGGGGWYVRSLLISALLLALLPLILTSLCLRGFSNFQLWCRNPVSAQSSCGRRTRGAGGGVGPVRK